MAGFNRVHQSASRDGDFILVFKKKEFSDGLLHDGGFNINDNIVWCTFAEHSKCVRDVPFSKSMNNLIIIRIINCPTARPTLLMNS